MSKLTAMEQVVVKLIPYLSNANTDEKFKGHNRKKRAALNFISGYIDEEDRRYLAEKKYKIEYIDYDWSLNEQKDK